MEAVIIAGGMGSRLMPLTEHRPKHLLPVAGVPLVVHQLAKLAAAGVDRIVLATSYHAEQFQPTLGNGEAWGVELVYVREGEPLGTGGALRNVAGLLACGPDDAVIVLNGDVVSGHDLRSQLAEHRRRTAEVTLHLVEVPDARAFGCVPTDTEGRVTGFVEKSADPVSRQVNAGCYVFARRVIDEIPTGRAVSVERETFPALVAAKRRVIGQLDPSYWRDIGTPSALCTVSADLVRGIATSPAYHHLPGRAWVATDARVDAAARVGGGSAIGPGARVSAGAVVEGSVVCSGAFVGPGSSLVDAVVGPDAVIGANVVMQEAVVGDRAVVGAGCELRAGFRLSCDAELADGAGTFSPP